MWGKLLNVPPIIVPTPRRGTRRLLRKRREMPRPPALFVSPSSNPADSHGGQKVPLPPPASGVRRSGLLRSFGLCRFVYAGRMPSPILPLSGEGAGILFGSTLIRFQTTFASRSEPRFSSTKIVKAGRKRELVPGFPRRILFSAKIAKGESSAKT